MVFFSKHFTYFSSLKHTFRRYLVPKIFWVVAAATLKDVLSDPDKCGRFGALVAIVLLKLSFTWLLPKLAKFSAWSPYVDKVSQSPPSACSH